ncbi:MAG: hypothetical protein Q9P01_20255 [Anaerolineae bacterium]|nr:hypothetical protein [Anaerolineae bacterium]MDQ7037083.1 hypothetical protein [Anaerolineae bacterium]
MTQSKKTKQRSWQPTLINVLLLTALIIVAIHVVIYIAFGIALIPFPFDYDQAEGFELNNAILLSQGDCPYCNNNDFPFYASGYAPFFHILMIPFVWLFGAAYWYGRFIIFIATFVTAAAIAYTIKRDENRLWVGLLLGGGFLASNYIYHIGPLLRQHLLMVMFETLAIVIIAPAFDLQGFKRHKRLFIAFALLLLAGYTKQLAISTCFAIGLWGLIRNPRTTIIYSVGLGIVAALIFIGAMLVTDGHWWVNIITSNQNEYITQQFVGLMRQFITLHWTLLIMAFLMVLYETYFDRLSVYSVWFIVSFASTIGTGKWGAGDSYFATTLVAACLLSGLFIARSFNQTWHFPKTYLSHLTKLRIPTSIVTGFGLILVIIYGATVIKFPTSGTVFGTIADTFNIEPKLGHRYPFYDNADWTVGYAVTGHFPSEQDVENGWRIVARVRQAEGLVMSEDAGFSIQAGREVITNAVQLRNLWEIDPTGELGIYDPSNLLQMIENQTFGLIIRRGDFFPIPVLLAIDTYYELDETIPMNGFDYQLWIPKSPFLGFIAPRTNW